MKFCEIVQREIGYVEFFPFFDGPSKRGEIKSVRKCPRKSAHILTSQDETGFLDIYCWHLLDMWVSSKDLLAGGLRICGPGRTHPLFLGKGRFFLPSFHNFFWVYLLAVHPKKNSAKMGFPGCN